MKATPMVLAFVSVAALAAFAAACGGKNQGASGPGGPREGDDPATPFNDGAVKAAIAATPGVAACGVDKSTTMGAHLEAQRAAMRAAGEGGNVTQETFLCRAQGGGKWECTWSVSTVTPAKPEAENPEAESPEAEAANPCGDDGGPSYMILVKVADNGTIDRNSITCSAPG